MDGSEQKAKASSGSSADARAIKGGGDDGNDNDGEDQRNMHSAAGLLQKHYRQVAKATSTAHTCIRVAYIWLLKLLQRSPL